MNIEFTLAAISFNLTRLLAIRQSGPTNLTAIGYQTAQSSRSHAVSKSPRGGTAYAALKAPLFHGAPHIFTRP